MLKPGIQHMKSQYFGYSNYYIVHPIVHIINNGNNFQ